MATPSPGRLRQRHVSVLFMRYASRLSSSLKRIVNAFPRYLAIIALLVYAWLVSKGSLLQIGASTEAFSFRLAFTQPMTWLVFALTLLVAWGIWKHFAWAWWLGVIGGLVQLGRLLWWAAHRFDLNHLPGQGVWLVFAVLVTFLVLMVLPAVRHACQR
jgi:hypothetical protein